MTGGGARRESKVKVDIQTSTSSATSPSTEGSNDEYICTFVPKVGFISYLPFMGGEVYLRIPTTEGKLPITALTREYPGAVGLRYKNSEDQKSSVRSDGDFLFPPLGADKKFEVILDTQIGTPIKSSTSWDFKTIALVLLAFVVVMLVLFIFSTRESEKEHSLLFSAVSAWAGLAGICLTIVGVFIGMFVVAKDNFTEVKHELAEIKKKIENKNGEN
ncbi:hypothetical protein ACQ4LE_002026 [Meloidogyne hapla]